MWRPPSGLEAAAARLATGDASAGRRTARRSTGSSRSAAATSTRARRPPRACSAWASTSTGRVAGLSGGEAARASLPAILLTRFDVLLLDEPTNDLDFAGLERLERFLAGTRAASSSSRTTAPSSIALNRIVELER